MKTLASPEFRKSYQRLTERVIVTAYGRPIGIWEPYILGKHPVDEGDTLVKPEMADVDKGKLSEAAGSV